MLVNTEAIILGYINYSETSIILKSYTKEFGSKSFIIRGIRSKKKKKITLGQLQPLTILDIEFNNTKPDKLSYLKSIKIIHPFTSINTKISKINISLFLSEFLSKIFKIDITNKELYDFIKKSLLWFDSAENASNFHLLFIIKLTEFLGIMPKYSEIQFSFFDNPISQNYVEGEVVIDLHKILGIKFDYNNSVLNNVKQRRNMLNFLISYYEYHVGGFKKPKSIEILNEIFS